MVGKAKAPNAAEKQRLDILKEHCPCLLCLLKKGRVRLPDIQHMVAGFTRLGHEATYSSCEWHHRGLVPDGYTRQRMMGYLGPSLAMGKRTFVQEYGSEELLLAVQNYILEAYERFQWMDYDVPNGVRNTAVKMWVYGGGHS